MRRARGFKRPRVYIVRRGFALAHPGTPAGAYTGTVTGVTAAGYTWDGDEHSAGFSIQ